MNDTAWNRTLVTPEAITACGLLCSGLGEAIRGAAQVGDKELVKELGQELKWAGKSLTWLLREDRGSIKRNGATAKTD